MRPRELGVLELALNQGLRSGIRRAFKHTDEPPPSDEQIETILEVMVGAMSEWFVFEDDDASI